MLIPIRRIITCNNHEGRSSVLSDGPATNLIGGLTELWTTTKAPHDHASSADLGASSNSLEPAACGTVFRFFQISPEVSSAHLSLEEKAKAWSDLFASMNAVHVQPDTRRDPGMHKSATTDYIVLLQGAITLVLDDEEVDMKPFDVVIQRGTNHSWVNRGEVDALLMAVLVDAKGS
ncbi:cupin domain-containing protein [Pseudomonas brassicacearum]|uniref:cupin domain-containing protein n=1 Tax=Pseudomonas TaxID=286 RepID=UPI0018E8855E|nr:MULTISPECIES: cupin domain-containing protein [Pseudomonas]MBJ2345234.1 cupin domain-containing protein [Pseudomonas canavaninivorans]MBL3541325.1 cupin domain-containing protein [Pseudomonas sp. HB05]UVM46847.1 cupin domain-containing protein [Pseudomonas brassicacearum]